MIVLGIDPGSRVTGFGVIRLEGREQHYVDCGCIRLGSGPLAERLQILFSSLCTLIERYQPEHLSIEQVFMAKNASAALKLGHARGVAMVAATQQGIAVSEYSAKQIKSAVVGTGSAAKQQVQHMVKLLLNLSANPQEDAADALAAALCHARMLEQPALTGSLTRLRAKRVHKR